jgi:ubiquitin C-terminal hydrolase
MVVLHNKGLVGVNGMDKYRLMHTLCFYSSHTYHQYKVLVLPITKVKNKFFHKIHMPYYNYHKINLVQY